MAKTRECCGALSLRRTGDDLHVSLHKGFKIRLAGIVPVSLEFTGAPPLDLQCVGERRVKSLGTRLKDHMQFNKAEKTQILV